MYLLSDETAVVLTNRLRRQGATLFAIGGLLLLAVGRLLTFSTFAVLGMFGFYVAFALVKIPMTAARKVGKLRSYRYELTESHIRLRSEDDETANELVLWNEVTEFEIARKSNQSLISFLTPSSRIRIPHADLYRSNGDEPPLDVAAAAHFGNASALFGP